MTFERILTLRPPRIAQALVLTAAALHLWTPLHRLTVFSNLPLALALGVGGLVVMARGWWRFRRSGTPLCPTSMATTLVTDDIYRFTRNPMYLGLVGMLVGLAVGFGSAPFYVAAALYGLILDRVFIPFEEEKLTRQLGEPYRVYRERVRRWL
jgi:protein-S-isoprenylcysteine O-methyltransferase Ste14